MCMLFVFNDYCEFTAVLSVRCVENLPEGCLGVNVGCFPCPGVPQDAVKE